VKKLVLLVEDEKIVGGGMKGLLEICGLEVIWVRDSPSAFKTYDDRKLEIEVIVLDGYLEKTSKNTTIKFIEYVKADGFTKAIIATSTSELLVKNMMRAGCTDHCKKMEILDCLKDANLIS
jgi:CheY-like chemotaxis protein